MLSANLKEADPEVFDIIQKVGCGGALSLQGPAASRLMSNLLGKTKTETLHQPYPLGEFHLSVSPGCFG